MAVVVESSWDWARAARHWLSSGGNPPWRDPAMASRWGISLEMSVPASADSGTLDVGREPLSDDVIVGTDDVMTPDVAVVVVDGVFPRDCDFCDEGDGVRVGER